MVARAFKRAGTHGQPVCLIFVIGQLRAVAAQLAHCRVAVLRRRAGQTQLVQGAANFCPTALFELFQFRTQPGLAGFCVFAEARVGDFPKLRGDVEKIENAPHARKQFGHRFVNPGRAVAQDDELVCVACVCRNQLRPDLLAEFRDAAAPRAAFVADRPGLG